MAPPRIPQWLGRVWVTGTVCLISFIAYTSQIFIIWPWYGNEFSVDLLLLLGPFNVLVGFLFWNYYLCVTIDPGSPPKGWTPDNQSEEHYEVKRLTNGHRFCAHCEQYKPPRTHHCKQCKRCVLRMDHHCPWVNNCVGHYNYAHFLRFLFLVDISCTYHLAMMVKRVLDPSTSYWARITASQMLIIVGNFVACIPVIMAVGIFSLYHFYCVFTNTTTIEGWEKDKVARLIKRGKIRDVEFPYNLGLKANVRAVFGPDPLLWCWPLRKEPSSGLRFDVADGRDTNEQFSWPPKDQMKQTSTNLRRELAASPWTYGDGPNPDLAPSNSTIRQRLNTGTSKVPPYHPDYVAPSGEVDGEDNGYRTSSSPSLESSDNEYPDWYDGKEPEGAPPEDPEAVRTGGFTMRRGSEGYEVRPVDREQVLHQHLNETGEMDLSRYNRYVPETFTSDEDE